VIAPEFERDRAELQQICGLSESLRDLLARLDEWTLRERAVSQRRIDIGLLHSQIGNYNTLILTEIKTIKEGLLFPISTEE
jgi:hypothetical protein